MKKLLRDRYILIFLFVYISAFILLVYFENFPAGELISIFLIIGVFFTSISYFLTRSSLPLFLDQHIQKREIIAVISIILYFTISMTWYEHLLKLIIPAGILEDPRIKDLTILGYKLFFIVGIPILIYFLLYKFSLRKWGIINHPKAFLSRGSIFSFIIMTAILLSFQYFMGNGAKPIREGLITHRQLLIGIPLSYLWLIIEVGIVEEFFFRVFLQSRISVILKSQTAGIVISSLIFGLAHAPGIYLRGGGILANLGSEPSLFLSIGYSLAVLSIAGLFLALIWAKTKNFWLIVAIHASVDLLPGLSGFIEIWGIE